MKDSSNGRFLRRYTELPFLIDILQTRQISLVNPQFWDDRNDSYYIQQYGLLNGFESIFCMCLTETNETYHHWRVFSHGTGGVCIEFHKSMLQEDAIAFQGLRAEPVTYRTLHDLRQSRPLTEELPFLKRYAFSDEMEFRLVMTTRKYHDGVFKVPIRLGSISRIMLSPWLSKTVATQTKNVLKTIKGCSKMKIYRSTLVDNESWKKFAHNDVFGDGDGKSI